MPRPRPLAHTLARLGALALVALALTALVAPPTRAIEPILVTDGARCGDGRRAPAPKICADFEAAARVAPSDALAVRALRVWSHVVDPVEALTDRTTGVVLLSPSARMRDGRAFPPATYICPGAPPVVYVPWSLVDQVYGPEASYPESFLAFVLGHELGHRLNDFTRDGCQLDAFERPGKGLDEERLADFRGAFFAAVAGYDTRDLATHATVTRFLASEFKVRAVELEQRAGALIDALHYFDAYETLYQTGLALTLTGDTDAAVRLLDWADELVGAHGVPVPELSVAHALALIANATPDAPWLEHLQGLGAPTAALACRPVFPAHSALWQAPMLGLVRADRTRQAAARRDLQRARRLLQKADDLGASPLAVGTANACAALLLDEPDEALRLQERAVKRGYSNRTSPAVAQALMANEALFRFGIWLADAAPTNAAAMREGVGPMLAAFALHPALGRWLRGDAAASPAELARCAAPGAIASTLPSAPFVARPTGECPSGWDVAHVLPSPESRAATGSETGVTVCERDGRRLAHVVLPALTDPPRSRVDATLGLFDPVPAPLASFDAWACGCDALAPRGVSDGGDEAWLGACPRLGAATALVRVDPRGRVRQVAVLPLP